LFLTPGIFTTGGKKNNNNNTQDNVYGAVIMTVHVMNTEQRQVAADLWTKPIDLSHKPACRQLGNYIHHRHLLFSLRFSAFWMAGL